MKRMAVNAVSGVAAALLLASMVAITGWSFQHASGTQLLSTASASSIARMLSAQKMVTLGKRGPEIPDPHPDPDPWPYPGHPARSPVAAVRKSGLALAQTQKKTLRQDRLGIVAEPQLGRMHGCKPEQITIMPTDDCDPLTAKMQPAVTRFDQRVQAEHGDNFAGVHWTSGDVGPDTDAFPYYEHHGGYSGFGFHDTIFNSEKGVHPTMYKATVGWEPHRYIMGTSHMEVKREHSLKEYKRDNQQVALLIAEGNHDLVRSKTSSPLRAVKLLRDATVDFKAAHAYKTRMAAPAASRGNMADLRARLSPASAFAAQKTLASALQPRSRREAQAYVKGLQGNDSGGSLLNAAVGAIAKESRQLRDVANELQSGNSDRMERVSRETLDVKAALAALDTAASRMANVRFPPAHTSDFPHL